MSSSANRAAADYCGPARQGDNHPGCKVMVIGSRFSQDTTVYFGGLQAREITFVNSAALHVVTSYLRPGTYKLDLKSGEAIVHSAVDFTALPAPVDSAIDQAEALAAKDQTTAAIGILTNIATTHADYDVRVYVHYRAAQLYLLQGDYWKASEAAALFDPKVSMGLQTSCRYRLLSDELAYAISRSNNHDTDLRVADGSVKMDVTENPDSRFWRALMDARFGKMEQAKADLKFVLAAEPEKPSYRALGAYLGAQSTLGEFALHACHGQGCPAFTKMRCFIFLFANFLFVAAHCAFVARHALQLRNIDPIQNHR